MDGSDTYFDVLPYVRLGINHAHVGLICPTVDKNPIVHLEESVLCIVLKRPVSFFGMLDLLLLGLRGNADQWLRFWQMVAQRAARQSLCDVSSAIYDF